MLIACQVVGRSGDAAVAGAFFTLLERMLPLRLQSAAQAPDIHRPRIVFDDGRIDDEPLTQVHAPVLCLPRRRSRRDALRPLVASFTDDPQVPEPFRGRTLETAGCYEGGRVRCGPRDTVLAHLEGQPVWSVRTDVSGKRFHTALPLAELSPRDGFGDVFGGAWYLNALPLMHFLRELGVLGLAPAVLRAAFVIDDPNLHWPSYGCVRYRELADRAAKNRYHVAFATIPLDTWFTHPGAAQVFRSNPQSLSLLVHGNGHIRNELSRSYSAGMRTAILQQALLRIEKLERRAGVRVSRIMVPPHGACSGDMLAALASCGFESACLSAGSLRAHNPQQPWVDTLGLFTSERIEGCSVLPRWGLCGPVQGNLLVAAYLRRPMILRGHHHDLRDGLDQLDEWARFINGLGPVEWSNLSLISRRSSMAWMDGTTCRIRPCGAIVAVDPPEGAMHVTVDPSFGFANTRWRWQVEDNGELDVVAGQQISLANRCGAGLWLRERVAPPPLSIRPARIPSACAIARRLLTEARDRLCMGAAAP